MTESKRRTEWSWLGRIGYDEAFELQIAVRDALIAGDGPERLLLLEHPHVYTLGRNASQEDVLVDPEQLAERGVHVVATDRGGQVTYHGPGQLVGYPILDLNPDRRDLRRYVRDLQTVLVETLGELGIDAEGGSGDRIGVWTGGRKIASIGVHLARWRTTHGFALNVATDLTLFGGIVACGLPTVEMTSIARERGREPGLERVGEIVVERFASVFGRQLVAAPAEDWAATESGVSG